jgi:uncharacterized protein (TIRG00374 family)
VNTLRKAWRAGWRLAVCLLLLFWIFHAIFAYEAHTATERQGQHWDQLERGQRWRLAWSVGPRELGRTLALIDPLALLLSIGCMGATLALGIWRWRMVLRVYCLGLSLGRAAEISLIAQFFNAFLLGSTGGDLLKAFYAARETHHKKTEAVVTVFVDRLIGLFSMLLFGAMMMLLNLPFLAKHRELAVAAWVVLIMLALCSVILGLAFWGGLSRAWPNARRWLRQLPKGEYLEQAVDACRSFGRQRHILLRAMAVSSLLNVFCVLQLLSLAWGLKIQSPGLVWFVVVPLVICLSALPITPSGLGLRENLYVLMLSGPGLQLPPTTALSVSLLAYFGFLVWSLVGGLVYLAFKEKHHLAEVTHSEENG